MSTAIVRVNNLEAEILQLREGVSDHLGGGLVGVGWEEAGKEAGKEAGGGWEAKEAKEPEEARGKDTSDSTNLGLGWSTIVSVAPRVVHLSSSSITLTRIFGSDSEPTSREMRSLQDKKSSTSPSCEPSTD